ncbi:MAG: hypothetical protein [aquatic viral metagenome]
MITSVSYNNQKVVLGIQPLPILSGYEEVMIDVDGTTMSAAQWANNPNNNIIQVEICVNPNDAGYSSEEINCIKILPANNVKNIKVWSRINIGGLPGIASVSMTVYKNGQYNPIGAGELMYSNIGYVIAYLELLVGLIMGLLYMAVYQRYVYGLYIILVTWLILLGVGLDNGYMTWIADIIAGYIEYRVYVLYKQNGRISYTFR